MPRGRVVERALHRLEARAIGVDEGVVEEDQRGPPGLGEEVGVGEAEEEADLLARSVAQLVEGGLFGGLPEAAADAGGREIVAELDLGLEEVPRIAPQPLRERRADARGERALPAPAVPSAASARAR